MQHYVVGEGDTPESIAHQWTGDMGRASELVQHNTQKRQVFIGRVPTFADLTIGETLHLPPSWTTTGVGAPHGGGRGGGHFHGGGHGHFHGGRSRFGFPFDYEYYPEYYVPTGPVCSEWTFVGQPGTSTNLPADVVTYALKGITWVGTSSVTATIDNILWRFDQTPSGINIYRCTGGAGVGAKWKVPAVQQSSKLNPQPVYARSLGHFDHEETALERDIGMGQTPSSSSMTPIIVGLAALAAGVGLAYIVTRPPRSAREAEESWFGQPRRHRKAAKLGWRRRRRSRRR